MIADRARELPDPEEGANAALQTLQPAIEAYPLEEPNFDAEARMRQMIAVAVAEVIGLAMSRLG